jgi:hypothetical protein
VAAALQLLDQRIDQAIAGREPEPASQALSTGRVAA